MQLLRLLLSCCAVVVPAAALEVAGSLTLVPSSSSANRFNVNITASPAVGSGTTNASGTMNVVMEVDPISGRVSQLSFSGGQAAFSNMNIPLRAFVFITVANVSTSDLVGFPWTAAPPAPVNPANGNIDATLHRFTVNQGQINGATTVAFGDVPAGTTFASDFATTPISGPAEGTGTVALVDVPDQATIATRTWRTTLSLPLSIVQTSDLNGTAVTLRLTGNLRAEANIVIPRNEYYAWTLANQLAAPPFGSEMRSGEPLGVVWAMGLTPFQSLRPHLPTMVMGTQQALVVLPAGGTAAPIFVEVSDNLATGTWSNAPPASLSGGLNPVPAGTSGQVSIQLSGPRQFVRLRANP